MLSFLSLILAKQIAPTRGPVRRVEHRNLPLTFLCLVGHENVCRIYGGLVMSPS